MSSRVLLGFFTVTLMEANWKSGMQPFLLCNSNALNGLLCMTYRVSVYHDVLKCLLTWLKKQKKFHKPPKGLADTSRCCFGCLPFVCSLQKKKQLCLMKIHQHNFTSLLQSRWRLSPSPGQHVFIYLSFLHT